jgi:phage FluMu gp28-like protein
MKAKPDIDVGILAGGVLFPYQQRWVADTGTVKLAEKSRRIGLTWGEAANSALEAASANGQDTWYLGYTKDMAQEFIRDCAFWVGHYQLAAEAMEEVVIDDEDNDILCYRINFASGHRITALSSSPRNLRGKQGRVIIDEAAFHPDLKALLTAAFALLIWGGSVSIISTHFGVDNYFNELIQEVREGRKPYSLHRITFNQAIEEGLCKRVFATTGREWSPEAETAWENEIRAIYRPNDAEELDCVPSSSSGAYLSRALIESRMVDTSPVLRFNCKPGFEQLPDDVREKDTQDWIDKHLKPLVDALPKNQRSSVGLDFGRSGDLTVITPLLEGPLLERVAPFILELRNTPFVQQKQILFWLCDNLPRFNYAALDSRGNGQYLGEVTMQKYGAASVAQVMPTQKWYLENFPRLKAAFEDGNLAAIPKDRDILDDLRCVVMEKGIPKVPEGKGKGQDGGQRHGDAAISLCLAYFASNQGGGPIEYIAVPLRDRGASASNVMQSSMQMRASNDDGGQSYERRGDY